MKFLDKNEIETIDELMFNKALDVDVALYNYQFDNSDPTFVETSLYLYVNEDGGFGHDLSLDNLNPNSLTYETYQAFKIFKECDVIDGNRDDISKELIFNALDYLWKKNIFSSKDESNDKYACAQRFKGSAINDMYLGICGYTILFAPKGSKYYRKALKVLDDNLDNILNIVDYDYFTLDQYKIFLISILMNQEFSDKFSLLEKHFNELLTKFLDTSDVNKDYFEILSLLEDFELSENEDKIFNLALDSLVDARKKHGMWENTHQWGTENIYPEASTAELKWIGRATRMAIHYLNKYNRIK